ncbi:MAG: alpha/beta hydrolase [Pseudomonadota bacterium]
MRRRTLLALGAGAVVAACAAREATMPDPEALYPPEGDFVTVEGTRLHYLRQGAGPPLILIHGASGNLRDWSFGIMGEMAKTHDVIAFDRPGHGYSERPATSGAEIAGQALLMRGAAAALGVERAVLAGHSFGGAVALAWAADAPESVAGLLLVSAAAQPWEGGPGLLYSLAAGRVTGPVVATALPRLAAGSLVDGALERVFAPEAMPEGYGEHVGTGLALRPRTVRWNAEDIVALKPQLARLAPRYPTLGVRAEIVHGTADRVVPLAVHGEPLSAALPNARLTSLPGAGHMPHHTRPAAVLEALARL